MAASVVSSYIIHHVFSYFDLYCQLRTLALVCKAWHHAALCMNCIITNATEQDTRQWFANYFDTEVAEVLVSDFKSIIGAPYSYVVRNLVLQVIRDIQGAVPNIEIEVFMLYSQLAKSYNRSEKLLKVYQVSALLYLLKKLEATFNIYDIFNDTQLALGDVKMPICRRDCLKMLVHVGSMLRFRFDQNSPHIGDNEFHIRAAIKCFDVKLLIKKNSPWTSIFELLDATIGPKFLRPDKVYQNFEQKLVEICKNDFSDFNELLSMMESDLIVTEEEGTNYKTSVMNMPRTERYIVLQPSGHCNKSHIPPTYSPPLRHTYAQQEDHDHDHHDHHDYHDDHDHHDDHNDTPSKYTTNNNNFDGTPNRNINNNNNNSNYGTPNSNISNNNSNSNTPNYNSSPNNGISNNGNAHDNDDDSSNTSDTKNQSDKYSNNKNYKYGHCNEQPKDNSLSIIANPQHETTIINHAETKTNNDESTSRSQLGSGGSSSANYKRPLEDYNYFFEAEENSIEDDDEEFMDFEDYEEFDDDEKENEPPAKFVKTGANILGEFNVHDM